MGKHFLTTAFVGLLLVGCQTVDTVEPTNVTSLPSFNDAMGWNLEGLTLDGKPYAEVTVLENDYAQQQGFESGDLIPLDGYVPSQSYSNGVLQDQMPDAYLKSLVVEICGAGLEGATPETLHFQVLRNNEVFSIDVVDVPEMECA